MELLGSNFLQAFASVLDMILTLYFWIIVASALISWVNPDPYNPIIRTLRTLTEPVLYRVRKWLPFTAIGGIDFSPVLVLLAIQFVKMFLVRTLSQMAVGLQ